MNKNPSISIDHRKISKENPPYIIAEMSANHNGKIENAFKIIDEAKNAKADAVKIQTYTADTITIKSNKKDFLINDGLWAGRSLYNLYDEAHMPWEWHKPIFDYAKEVGITIFSSPFDKTAVDLLEDLNAPAYKIASFEAIDLPLIKYVASTSKPMIISTGMANKFEIKEAINCAKDAGCNQLAILHCVSGYPAPSWEYNINTIEDMINEFGLVTGLSDHTQGNITAITSIAKGASIIEKHFTLNKNGGGPDDSFSLEPHEMNSLCEESREAWECLGAVDYGKKSSEMGNIKFRRSLYFVKDIKKGEIIKSNAVRSVRPGYGIAPKYLEKVIGAKAKNNIVKNSPVGNEYIK